MLSVCQQVTNMDYKRQNFIQLFNYYLIKLWMYSFSHRRKTTSGSESAGLHSDTTILHIFLTWVNEQG